MIHRVLVMALALTLWPPSGHALAPAVLLMIKQIVQQSATQMIKSALLSSLDGLGCKGIALANAIQGVGVLRGGGGLGALGGMSGMTGMTGMSGMTGFGSAPTAMPPEMAARMSAMMRGAGGLPPGMALSPEQAAMMAGVQQAMAQPLSPAETHATIDALFELGFLPRPVQVELRQCMVLVPATVPALGMAMGMLRPVLPELRQAHQQLRALSPQEQDEVAEAMAQEMRPLLDEERAAVVEHLDSGFFPPRIAAGVKRRLAAP